MIIYELYGNKIQMNTQEIQFDIPHNSSRYISFSPIIGCFSMYLPLITP